MKPTTHVVLGTGPLGLATARALTSRGLPVTLVSRSGRAPDAPAGVRVEAADVRDEAALRRVLAGAAVVYQCAQPAYHRWPEEFPSLQAAVLVGARAVGARLVVAENLYMYGPVQGPVREGLPHRATTRKGAVRAALAEALLEAHRRGEVQVAMARGSDFFGPGVHGSAVGERLFLAALQGKPVDIMGRPEALHSYTFIDDFGAALATLGTRDEALGKAWHVPSAPAVSNRAFAELVVAAAGGKSTVRPVPRWMLQAMGLFVPPVREMVEMLYEFEEDFVVDATPFESTFGLKATPLDVAVPLTVASYARRAAA